MNRDNAREKFGPPTIDKYIASLKEQYFDLSYASNDQWAQAGAPAGRTTSRVEAGMSDELVKAEKWAQGRVTSSDQRSLRTKNVINQDSIISGKGWQNEFVGYNMVRALGIKPGALPKELSHLINKNGEYRVKHNYFERPPEEVPINLARERNFVRAKAEALGVSKKAEKALDQSMKSFDSEVARMDKTHGLIGEARRSNVKTDVRDKNMYHDRFAKVELPSGTVVSAGINLRDLPKVARSKVEIPMAAHNGVHRLGNLATDSEALKRLSTLRLNLSNSGYGNYVSDKFKSVDKALSVEGSVAKTLVVRNAARKNAARDFVEIER